MGSGRKDVSVDKEIFTMSSPYMVRTITEWPLDKLVAAANSPRTHSTHQIQKIAAAIEEFGFVNPILAAADGVIIAGHGRRLAAKRLRMTHVPVIQLDHLNQAQRRALALADNQLPLSAGWDEELLRLQLEQLKEDGMKLELTGFDTAELERLLAVESDRLRQDEDAVPNAPPVAASRPGDLWILGEHRLFCGDATAAADTRTLMGEDLADLVITDPPYNVDYEGHTADRLKIAGDHMSTVEFAAFLERVFRNYRLIVKLTASAYIFHPSRWQCEFQVALEKAGFAVRSQLIWAKNTFAWGFARYKFQHEPIFYCYISGESDAWYGDKSQSTIWAENKPSANRLHPTTKPVELVERALVNSSRAGDVVVDLFGGSGSTLIGCERRGRRARLMEIDPQYVDVIVRRWQEYTHEDARLAEDGRTYHEIAAERQRVAA
jgi:DNA modification methylase